jgi:cobyrinic acid a,c-diamide synthase
MLILLVMLVLLSATVLHSTCDVSICSAGSQLNGHEWHHCTAWQQLQSDAAAQLAETGANKRMQCEW